MCKTRKSKEKKEDTSIKKLELAFLNMCEYAGDATERDIRETLEALWDSGGDEGIKQIVEAGKEAG